MSDGRRDPDECDNSLNPQASDSCLCANSKVSRPLTAIGKPSAERAFAANNITQLEEAIQRIIAPRITSW